MYLEEEIGFDEFEVLFSELFLNRIPEGTISSSAMDIYGAINEKLMWTALRPSLEERSLGWIDRSEFRKWLADTLSPQ
jgi:hypothetical protein